MKYNLSIATTRNDGGRYYAIYQVRIDAKTEE